MPSAASSGRSDWLQHARLLVDLRERAAADRRQLLLGGQAVDRDVFDAGAELLEDGRDAHHEELVEVGAGDGQELDALEQRMRRVLRLRQHALVERQPAQLAIDDRAPGLLRSFGSRFDQSC